MGLPAQPFKELFLSSKMRWIAQNQQRSMEEVMKEQAQLLREQMISAPPEPEAGDDPSAQQSNAYGMFVRHRGRGPFIP